MSAKYFEYDSDVFSTASKAYGDAYAKLNKLKTNLDNGISDLRTDWDSEAGKAFFKSYDDDWKTILDQYLNLLAYLQSCIDEAKKEFDPLVTELESIKP